MNNKFNNKLTLINYYKPKTKNQRILKHSILDNTVTIGYGPSGCGKTMATIGLACNELFKEKIDKVLVTRPIVSCDTDMGAFPGSAKEKLGPYISAQYDYFNFFLGKSIKFAVEKKMVEFWPTQLLRGHTFKDTWMILDEAQNCTPKQLKMFLSRLGENSKVIILGDTRQQDIKRSGLEFCISYLTNLESVEHVELNKEDILRHPLIPHILDIFEEQGV